jgi:hypothetical protein
MVLHSAPVLAAASPFVFRDVATEVGLREPLKGVMAHSAAWGDVNDDGWIDLFVGTYTDRPTAFYVAGGADGPVPNRLLINRNGRFTLSQQPTMAWFGRASGSVFADLDNDGRADLYVGNNGKLGKENLLYHNCGDGRFEDVTDRTVAPMQLPEAARSVSVVDFDKDGLLDVLVLAGLHGGDTLLFRNRGGMKCGRLPLHSGSAEPIRVARP